MCDLTCVNLIDLSLEDEIPCTNAQTVPETSASLAADTLFISPLRCDSLENNPFDSVQKLADRRDDPFDIVEKEACLKAQHFSKVSPCVKLGNLVSLSDDNLLNELQTSDTHLIVADEIKSARLHDLDLESPPVILDEKITPDSLSGPDIESTPNSVEISTSTKLRKLENRKKLLKLCISNSAYSSPTIPKHYTGFADILSTPVSSMLSDAAEFGEHLLTAESPLKFVEDDLSSLQNFTDSEKKFEADLEMLNIPMLNDISSPDVSKVSTKSKNSPELCGNSQTLENSVSNLDAIKAKLKAKKEEINCNQQQEIASLIKNLKFLISSGEMVDNDKKKQASDLLESLSIAIKPLNTDVLQTSKTQPVPQQIKRQGTFDLELQEKQESSIDAQPSVQELPNCMVSSSATYDGETHDPDLNLPEITPLSPQGLPTTQRVLSPNCYQNIKINNYQNQTHSDDNHNLNLPDQSSPQLEVNHNYANQLHTDVNDIVGQLSTLLINNSADIQTNCNNPTFIVVMNANQLNHSNTNYSNQNIPDVKVRSALVGSYLDNSVNDGSPELTKVDHMPRRRSQSLSIHDKIKIVQLPQRHSTSRFIQKQNSVPVEVSIPITTTPPSDHNQTHEFKTPARLRRNSYSSATPYKAQERLRITGFGSESKNFTQLRRTHTLDTHHEGQQKAIVRPMFAPSNNLLTFKPDLKKKSKHNTESIIKSSGPLKATIPVKKVAPILKTLPPTPEKNAKCKISTAPTTPMSAKGNSTLVERVGYPNACSTPGVSISPLKRTTGSVTKPRYSYMSATPNSKSFIANLSLKRRTIAEFKAKSPIKPRINNTGLSTGAPSSSRTSTPNSRLSISAGARISKTPVKSATGNTATVKPTSRLSSRMSVGSSLLYVKNKENKRP